MALELIATAAIAWGAAGAIIAGFRKWARNEALRREAADRRREDADRRRDAEIAGLKSAVEGLKSAVEGTNGLVDKLFRLYEASEQRR